jgi:murein DD-endopeptidase MepM/ murein hydrolase activator NlpD
MPHFWTRVSLIGSAAATLAACATPQYPTAEGQTARAPLTMPTPNFPIGQQPGATTTSTVEEPQSAAIESQTLAPPPAAVSSQPLTPITAPSVDVAAPPVTRTVTVAGGKVVDAQGKPTTYEVQSGDTLYSISRKLGTSVSQLSDDNGISSPSSIRPGQVLKGPSVKAKAYVVTSGDTMFAIARRFGVSAQSLADANERDLNAPISVGQKLVLPDGYKDKGPTTRTVTVTPPPQPAYTPPVQIAAQTVRPPEVQPAPRVSAPITTPVMTPVATTVVAETPAAVVPPPGPKPYPPAPSTMTTRPVTPPVTKPYVPPVTTPPVAKPYTPPASTVATAKPYTPSTPVGGMIPTNAPPTDNEVARAGAGRFVWPVMGDVVQGFGPKGGGQRNDGLNIRATSGAKVGAAANGEVVYAGDQVPGFGNLVLVKHADGWVTAYAHLSRIDVKMRDPVMQGQQIGAVGSTGGVAEPQLHFEVRYAPSPQDKARPVDPSLVLPRA